MDAQKVLILLGGAIVTTIVGAILLALLSTLVQFFLPLAIWLFGLAILGLAIIAVIYFVLWVIQKSKTTE